MAKIDTRVRLTKQLLKNSLLELLETTPISRISVKDLCDKANLNRGTFYLHYNEPNDVLKEIEQEYIDEKMSFFDPYMKNDRPDLLAKLFETIIRNKEISVILFGKNGAPQFTERIKLLVRDGVVGDWQREFPNYRTEDLMYVYEFVFPGAMQLILNWLKGDDNLSAEEFAHRLDCLGHYCHLAIKEFHAFDNR